MSRRALAKENPAVWRKTLWSVRDEAGCTGGEEEHARSRLVHATREFVAAIPKGM
jgi:hypothetical protein